MIKVVYIDFDNTLYSHFTSSIPGSAIKSINLLRQKGIKVFLCTGRTYYEMSFFDISAIELDGMILSNGQVAYDKNNNIIYEKPIEGILKDKIIELYQNKNLPIFIATKDSIQINYVNDKVKQVQQAIDTSVPEIKPYNNESFYMSAAFIENKKQLNEVMKLNDIAEITFWHEGAVDIVPKGISKSSGIDIINKKYGFNKKEVMAIGDGENDILMLKNCAIGVAMGNSSQDIKDIADYVTSHIDDDGLYKAFKHYKMI